RALAVHPSGEWIALLCGDGQALEYSVTTHAIRSLFRFASPHPPVAPLHNGDCAYSPDGRWLVAWGLNDGCFVWDCATGRTCVEPVADSGTVFDVDFLGDMMLSARMNQSSGLDFRALPAGAPAVPSIPYSNWPFLVRFHPGGEWILTTGRDRAGQVWDWRGGRRVGPPLPHEGEVMAGAFVPGQPWAVTGGHDGRIRTWAIPSGMPMGPTLEMPATVLTLQFSPTARSLIACGFFGGWIGLYDWERLFPEASLNPDDARLLAELDASATINAEGGLVPLSAAEWLARWKEFRSRHPKFPNHSLSPGPTP
ncbi:MAG: hypothetical protein J0L84_16740, partial [Verrucomicrobia bacterium]|nr:hypothetical protein [Verrucomicrobiota bacterium]